MSSSIYDPGTASAQDASRAPESIPKSAPESMREEALSRPVDGWVPEDREPSAAENNFMSFALFGFLILFGISCFILF